MYDIKENALRQTERIEEELLRKLFKTRQESPFNQKYFEIGHIPAKFAKARVKIVILIYILAPKENSLM